MTFYFFRTLVGYFIAPVVTAEIFIPVYFKNNLSSVYQVKIAHENVVVLPFSTIRLLCFIVRLPTFFILGLNFAE